MSAFQFSRTTAIRPVFAGALAAVLLVAAVPARAQDNGYDVQFLQGLMGAIGLRSETKDIDYRERSPLVIPPRTTLPPPVSGTVAAPNWPVDPEVKLKRTLEANVKSAPGATGDPSVDDARPLGPAQLERGRTATTKRSPKAGTTEWLGRQSLPQELGSPTVFQTIGKAFSGVTDKEESAPFKGEPARTSLIEPPAGYQTPATGQRYGLGKDNKLPVAVDYRTTHGSMDK